MARTSGVEHLAGQILVRKKEKYGRKLTSQFLERGETEGGVAARRQEIAAHNKSVTDEPQEKGGLDKKWPLNKGPRYLLSQRKGVEGDLSKKTHT